MAEKTASYFSYLLRLWREDRDDEIVWRASLESAQTAERHNFTTIDDLFDFLCERTTEPTDSEPEEQAHQTEV